MVCAGVLGAVGWVCRCKRCATGVGHLSAGRGGAEPCCASALMVVAPSLQRFTTRYIPAEDRMRLAGELPGSQQVVLWLL